MTTFAPQWKCLLAECGENWTSSCHGSRNNRRYSSYVQAYTSHKIQCMNIINNLQPINNSTSHGVSRSILIGFLCVGLSFSNPRPILAQEQGLYDISLLSDGPTSVLQDFARVLNPANSDNLVQGIQSLENETGWKLRVVTNSGSLTSVSVKDLKDLWKPDDKTIIVIEDLTSPNILNFNTGSAVGKKLPRQFFSELQSRYGNQFYVGQEGEGVALISTVRAIDECLRKSEGCKSVPGLTSDLYNLTFATSLAGGCVFGFAARLPPSGRVEASWQWLIFLSPLWLLLFGAFGILPVISRTSELEPIIKNGIGFAVGAAALYLTPIFGPSPISKR